MHATRFPATGSAGAVRGAAAAAFFIAALTTGARARMQPGQVSDPVLGPWFRSLMQPGTGASCCAEADCRQTDFRINGDHYEAWIDGRWEPVPPQAVLKRTDNPTGRAVVCSIPTLGIICFVRGPET